MPSPSPSSLEEGLLSADSKQLHELPPQYLPGSSPSSGTAVAEGIGASETQRLLPYDTEKASSSDREEGGGQLQDAPLLGMLLCASSTLFQQAMMLIVKLLGRRGIPVFEILFVRVGLIALLASGNAARQSQSPLGVNRRLLLLRGALGFSASSCGFWAVSLLPLGDAAVLTLLAPVVVAVLAPVALREQPTRMTVAALACCVVGAVLIARPSFSSGTPSVRALGVALGCLQALFASCARLVVRELRRTDQPNVIVFYSAAMSTAGAAAGCAWQGPIWVTSLLNITLLTATGVLGYICQFSLTMGLRYAKAAPATAMSYLSVVWGLVGGYVAFHEVPAAASLVGVGLICGSTLALTCTERGVGRAPG